jgi:hypothetical protein
MVCFMGIEFGQRFAIMRNENPPFIKLGVRMVRLLFR